MRIIQAHKFYRSFGGVDTCVAATETLLRARGHEVIPFAMSHPDNWPSEHADCFVREVDYGPFLELPLWKQLWESGKILYSIEARRKFGALCNRVRPDLVHVHNIYHQISPSVLDEARARGIPVVQTLHDYHSLCPQCLLYAHDGVCEACRGGRYTMAVRKRCIRASLKGSLLHAIEAYLHRWMRIYERAVRLFISPSEFLRSKSIELGMPGDRIVVLPNFLEPQAPARQVGEEPFALYSGRLEREKGVWTLLRAARSIPGFRLKVAGQGRELEAIRSELEGEGGDRIELLGFLPPEANQELLRSCLFAIVPSECYENCSMSVLEAFAEGKAVVASRSGGIPEQVEHGGNGLLFEPGDAEGLQSAIRELWAAPERARRLGEAAGEKARNIYSPEYHYRGLMKIYRSAIEGGPAPGSGRDPVDGGSH
jgi:glycosyltransferase involved in cell wall biosynthesis